MGTIHTGKMHSKRVAVKIFNANAANFDMEEFRFEVCGDCCESAVCICIIGVFQYSYPLVLLNKHNAAVHAITRTKNSLHCLQCRCHS